MASVTRFTHKSFLQRLGLVLLVLAITINPTPYSAWGIAFLSSVAVPIKFFVALFAFVAHSYLFSRARSMLHLRWLVVIAISVFLVLYPAWILVDFQDDVAVFVYLWVVLTLTVFYSLGLSVAFVDSQLSGVRHQEEVH